MLETVTIVMVILAGILNIILLLVEDEMMMFTTKATRMIFKITIILYMMKLVI